MNVQYKRWSHYHDNKEQSEEKMLYGLAAGYYIVNISGVELGPLHHNKSLIISEIGNQPAFSLSSKKPDENWWHCV